jgi:cell division protein FtsL
MNNTEIEQQIQKRYDAIQALKEQINDLAKPA